MEEEAPHQVLTGNEEVFKEESSTLQGAQAKILVSPDAVPRFFQLQSVLYAMQVKVDQEIDRVKKKGTLVPVKYSEWAVLAVPFWNQTGP